MKKINVLLLAFLLLSFWANAQQYPFNGLDMNMGNLSRLSNAQSRSISPENFTGEKGKGAMADPVRDKDVRNKANASGPIETYFARAGIPYKIVGGQRFYDRKEIKDMLAYMSIVANEQDDLRLRRIINEPARKIGATTVQNVADIAAGLGVSMLEVIEDAPDYPALARASAALGGFWRIYRRLKEAYDTLPLDVFVSEILEITGYRSMLEAEGEEGQTRMENIG